MPILLVFQFFLKLRILFLIFLSVPSIYLTACRNFVTEMSSAAPSKSYEIKKTGTVTSSWLPCCCFELPLLFSAVVPLKLFFSPFFAHFLRYLS
jgi:hypothetical protein